MTPPNGLLHKGTGVEEWLDLHFFRPLGLRVVRVLAPSRVTADQVTLAALLVGLLAGHLFFYRSPTLNVVGLALFLGSDVLDSADGQLARLRGSATRFGAILDGIADNARFLNLYLHLLARVLVSSAAPVPWLVGLALAAGASHALQASIADFLRQVYLFVVSGTARLDLPEDLDAERPTGLARRLLLTLYRPYVARQARWCPSSAALVRRIRAGHAPAGLADAWQREQGRVLARSALIGQNIRFMLLGATALPGWPAGFFWLTIGPLNLALLVILVVHEGRAERLGRAPLTPQLAPARSTG